MNIRFFKPEDAKTVLSWITSEREFKMWSADQYGNYPIKPEDIIENYKKKMQESEFYPLIFEEKGKAVGHMILRYPTTNKKLIRLGFIIVDKKKRHKGYGRKIIFEAMKYATRNFDARKFCLGVFTNNLSAKKCYEAVGFKPIELKKNMLKFHDEEWDWLEMFYDVEQKAIQQIMEYVYGKKNP